jgi:hypothetical protein
MSDVALRYRVKKGNEWWHVLDTSASAWHQTVDRHVSEDKAVESCRRFNEGTHPLVEEMRLSPQEWQAVVRMLRWSNWYARHAPRSEVDCEFDAAHAGLAPLHDRLGWG